MDRHPGLVHEDPVGSLPTYQIRGQSIAEGDGDLIVVQHANTDFDTLVFDARTGKIIPVLTGPAIDFGYYIP